MRFAILVAVAATCFANPSQAASCGWYAIYACSKSASVDGPGNTVSTNPYPNFRKGYYCNLGGPFSSRADAMSQVKRFGGYAKLAC